MPDSYITTQLDQRGVATITLDRADKHNAFNSDMIVELTDSLIQLAQAPQLRLLILTAEGESFSAGADLNWMRDQVHADYSDNLEDAQRLATLLKTLEQFPCPTIARIQGNAFGGGLGLICCCDIAIACHGLHFSLSETRLGLTPATIGPYVVAAMGQRAARRYFISAELIDANTALQLQLIHELVEPPQLDSRIEQLTHQLLSNGPRAMQAAKQQLRQLASPPIDDALIARTCEQIAFLRVSPEGQEGLTAFLEKRLPRWSAAATTDTEGKHHV